MDRRIVALALVVGSLLVVRIAHSDEDFRCETDVYVGTQKEPAQQTLTLFVGRLVYDFLPLSSPEEITLYDIGRGEIKLLDKRRKIVATMYTDDLLQFTAAFKIIKPETDLFKFCADPVFKEEFNEQDSVLKLVSPPYKYEVACDAQDHPGTAARYREFADWSARLNAVRPKNLPPFPRLELNKALAARELLPKEVERTITKPSQVLRSRHNYNWALSAQDRQRIEEVETLLTKYAPATVEDYLGLNKKTTDK